MLKSIILLALLLAVLMAGIQGQYVPSSSDETQQEEERTVQTEGPVSHDPTTILATAAPTPSPTASPAPTRVPSTPTVRPTEPPLDREENETEMMTDF